MTESVITEYDGGNREKVSRIYRYGPGGVRVYDGHERLRRMYTFSPGENTMTENDPKAPSKILRRFVFDNYGMLEETFSFGNPPRTYRYENGGQQIVMREGGDYGAVGKTYSFEGPGVAETAFGRDGSIERVFVFEKGQAITIRRGGWYGEVERTLAFDRIDPSVFRAPDSFLQFLAFTDKSQQEIDEAIDEEVAKIRAGSGGNRYACTAPRQMDGAPGRGSAAPGRVAGRGRPARDDDSGIDFIADADSARNTPRGPPGSRGQSTGVPFEERWQSATNGRGGQNSGGSAGIPLDERFRSSREEERTLSRGMSANIPLDERFRSSREEDRTLNRGRSADIPLDERFRSSEEDKDELTPGRSTRISYEERKAGRRTQ